MTNDKITTVRDKAEARQQDDGLWDVARVADFLSLSQTTIWRRIRSGSIPFRRIGGRVLFVPDEVREWIRQQPAA